MKLPAKIEYASRAILELSLRYKGDTPVQISTIARMQHIPHNFLPQLLMRMKNAGIVHSSRGVAGGYYLAKDPSSITLADVVKAIDASILEAPRKPKAQKPPGSSEVIRLIWDDINTEVTEALDKATFNLLASRARNEQMTYQI